MNEQVARLPPVALWASDAQITFREFVEITYSVDIDEFRIKRADGELELIRPAMFVGYPSLHLSLTLLLGENETIVWVGPSPLELLCHSD